MVRNIEQNIKTWTIEGFIAAASLAVIAPSNTAVANTPGKYSQAAHTKLKAAKYAAKNNSLVAIVYAGKGQEESVAKDVGAKFQKKYKSLHGEDMILFTATLDEGAGYVEFYSPVGHLGPFYMTDFDTREEAKKMFEDIRTFHQASKYFEDS